MYPPISDIVSCDGPPARSAVNSCPGASWPCVTTPRVPTVMTVAQLFSSVQFCFPSGQSKNHLLYPLATREKRLTTQLLYVFVLLDVGVNKNPPRMLACVIKGSNGTFDLALLGGGAGLIGCPAGKPGPFLFIVSNSNCTKVKDKD